MIDFIAFCTSAVWRLTKLFLSLIMCGVCFIATVFMAITVIIIVCGGKNEFWRKENEPEEERR